MGQGAFLGEESVLAASGQAGEITAGVGWDERLFQYTAREGM